jgi:hypothetical protein
VAGERHNSLLRSDRTWRCTGQVKFLVFFVILLLVQRREGNGVRWANRRHRGRIGSRGCVQAVRGLPVGIFLGLIEENHGYAVAGGVRGIWVQRGRVSEYVMVCAEERGLDLRDGLLGRRGIHRRTRFPERRGQVPLGR